MGVARQLQRYLYFLQIVKFCIIKLVIVKFSFHVSPLFHFFIFFGENIFKNRLKVNS